MKKILSRILSILIAFILFILLISLFSKNKNKSNDEISTYTVTIWDIKNTVDVYWNAKLVDEAKLHFNLPWEVADIFVNQWDTVKKWDILAILDTIDLDNQIAQAEISLENAKINYNTVRDWSTNTQILQAENSLAQSERSLQLAKEQYNELVRNSDIDSIGNSNSTALKSAMLSIKDLISQWEKAIVALDKIFGVSSKYASDNDSYEEYLSKKNIVYKRQTSRLISSCYNSLEDLQYEYYYIDDEPNINDKNNVIDSLKIAENLYECIYDATEYAYKACENSEINEYLTQTMISTFESTISSYWTLAKWSLNSILTTKNTISNLSSSNSTDLSIQAKEAEIETLENAIRLQKQILQDTKNWSTDNQKAIAQNWIKQSELVIANTKKWIENYQIIAPFDWKIRKIDFNIWDKIVATDNKFIYIENPDLVDISLLLDQVDIVQVEEWMLAEVEFDAYPGIIFHWVLWEIDTSANISAGVVSYTVKIRINKWDYKIYGWMSANVKIIKNQKKNVIQIPTSYVQTEWNKNYVLNLSWEKIEIKTWISDDLMVEIKSWLKKWDIIAKEIVNNWKNSFISSMEDMSDMWM